MVHNEENRAFILSEKGASRMDFHHQWEYEEAPSRGLRNPWNYRPDKPTYSKAIVYPDPNNRKHGIQTIRSIYPKVSEEIITAWKAERDEYMRQRDEWIALQMFHEYGYEAFVEEVTVHDLSTDFWKTVFPCESKNEPQCYVHCPIYFDCALRLTEAQKGD